MLYEVANVRRASICVLFIHWTDLAALGARTKGSRYFDLVGQKYWIPQEKLFFVSGVNFSKENANIHTDVCSGGFALLHIVWE